MQMIWSTLHCCTQLDHKILARYSRMDYFLHKTSRYPLLSHDTAINFMLSLLHKTASIPGSRLLKTPVMASNALMHNFKEKIFMFEMHAWQVIILIMNITSALLMLIYGFICHMCTKLPMFTSN